MYLANWDKIVCSCVPNNKQMCQLSCMCVMFHSRGTKNSSQEQLTLTLLGSKIAVFPVRKKCLHGMPGMSLEMTSVFRCLTQSLGQLSNDILAVIERVVVLTSSRTISTCFPGMPAFLRPNHQPEQPSYNTWGVQCTKRVSFGGMHLFISHNFQNGV